MTARNVAPIKNTFINRMTAEAFTRDSTWEENNFRPITGFYRDIGGLNQKIWLGKHGNSWEIGVHSDVAGLHGFYHLDVLVPSGAGASTPHFYTNVESYFSRGGSNEKEVTIFNSILDKKLLASLQQFKTSEDIARIFPPDINIDAISRGRHTEDYGYGYYPSVRKCFMRMISTNLYLGNLELAKAQATTLLLHLRGLPYDTSHDQSLADGVLKIAANAEGRTPLGWGSPP